MARERCKDRFRGWTGIKARHFRGATGAGRISEARRAALAIWAERQGMFTKEEIARLEEGSGVRT